MVRPPLLYLIEHRAYDPGGEHPFREDTLYVMSQDGVAKLVVLKCPNSECREILQVNTDPMQRPHWSLTLHSDRTISLHPPVRHSCGVRFYVSYGTVHFREDPIGPGSATPLRPT